LENLIIDFLGFAAVLVEKRALEQIFKKEKV